MFKKRIANIVFYKVSDEKATTKQATIFYADGTVENVSFDRGIDACEEIVKDRNIQTKDAFKEMINRDIVHVVSATEFKERFNSFIPAAIDLTTEEQVDNNLVVPAAAMAAAGTKVATEVADRIAEDAKEEVAEVKAEAEEVVADTKEEVQEVKEEAEEVKEEVTSESTEEEDKAEVKEEAEEVVADTKEEVQEVKEEAEEVKEEVASESTGEEDKAEGKEVSDSSDSAVVGAIPVADADDHIYRFDDEDEFDEDFDDDYDDELEDSDSRSEMVVKHEEKPKKEGFFKRMWRKFKESRLGVKLTAIGLAILLACGLYSCHQHKSLEGEMLNSNISGIHNTIDPNADTTFTNDNILGIQDVANAHYYDNAEIKALLDRTSNEDQKAAMMNIGEAMDGFNNNFASHYVEEGVDVRPSLKFDEVVALDVAYNDYGRDQLAAIFNGADVRSEDLTRAYKDASLQLMGAYAIENSEHPVDMSMLIDSQEGRDFYARYHNAFLAAKEAEGEEQIRLVTEFYNMVRTDFAIGETERTEGISHSENYTRIQPYQLSVAPMIAAGEMMWQNLDIDVTLNDSEIDFLNDLGLCNFADHTFERAETVALSTPTDKNNPTYDEYKDAYVKYYTGLGTYYVDDEHRELTKLDSFQRAVNWHFEIGGWVYEGGSYTTTETHTETYSWEETETTYHEEVESHEVSEDQVPENVREQLQDQVDAEIEAENEEARRRAEEAAEAERQRLQEEEDRHAQEVEEEVRQDEQDLQERIEDANETIDEGGSVNEDDLGHGVDFDDEHSDSQGNLDSSVDNITTDPTGDMTDVPLPDPNETGREFDAQAETQSNSAPATNTQSFVESEESVSSNTSNDQWVETVPVDDDYYYEDNWVEYEDAVDEYVESMGNDTVEDEEAYQYSK